MMPEYVIKDYTVIVKDRSEYDSGVTVAVQASGYTPESAASEAESGTALEIWKRRYPGNPDPNDIPKHLTMTERDNEWIACMESVETVAVIEGTPKVYVEDAIFFPDEAAA